MKRLLAVFAFLLLSASTVALAQDISVTAKDGGTYRSRPFNIRNTDTYRFIVTALPGAHVSVRFHSIQFKDTSGFVIADSINAGGMVRYTYEITGDSLMDIFIPDVTPNTATQELKTRTDWQAMIVVVGQSGSSGLVSVVRSVLSNVYTPPPILNDSARFVQYGDSGRVQKGFVTPTWFWANVPGGASSDTSFTNNRPVRIENDLGQFTPRTDDSLRRLWTRLPRVSVHDFVWSASDTATTWTAVIQNALDSSKGKMLEFLPQVYHMTAQGASPYDATRKYGVDLKTGNTAIYLPQGATLKMKDGTQTDAGGAVDLLVWRYGYDIYIGGHGTIAGNTAGQTGWTGGYTQITSGCLINSYGDGTGSTRENARITVEGLTLIDHFSNPLNIREADNVTLRDLRTYGVGEGFELIDCYNVVADGLYANDSTGTLDNVAVGDAIEFANCYYVTASNMIVRKWQGGSALDVSGSRHSTFTNFSFDDVVQGITIGDYTGNIYHPDDLAFSNGVINFAYGSSGAITCKTTSNTVFSGLKITNSSTGYYFPTLAALAGGRQTITGGEVTKCGTGVSIEDNRIVHFGGLTIDSVTYGIRTYPTGANRTPALYGNLTILNVLATSGHGLSWDANSQTGFAPVGSLSAIINAPAAWQYSYTSGNVNLTGLDLQIAGSDTLYSDNISTFNIRHTQGKTAPFVRIDPTSKALDILNAGQIHQRDASASVLYANNGSTQVPVFTTSTTSLTLGNSGWSTALLGYSGTYYWDLQGAGKLQTNTVPWSGTAGDSINVGTKGYIDKLLALKLAIDALTDSLDANPRNAGGGGTITSDSLDLGTLRPGVLTTLLSLAAFSDSLDVYSSGVASNYVQNTVTISTTSPLGGGGDLSSNRTFTFDSTVLYRGRLFDRGQGSWFLSNDSALMKLSLAGGGMDFRLSGYYQSTPWVGTDYGAIVANNNGYSSAVRGGLGQVLKVLPGGDVGFGTDSAGAGGSSYSEWDKKPGTGADGDTIIFTPGTDKRIGINTPDPASDLQVVGGAKFDTLQAGAAKVDSTVSTVYVNDTTHALRDSATVILVGIDRPVFVPWAEAAAGGHSNQGPLYSASVTYRIVGSFQKCKNFVIVSDSVANWHIAGYTYKSVSYFGSDTAAGIWNYTSVWDGGCGYLDGNSWLCTQSKVHGDDSVYDKFVTTYSGRHYVQVNNVNVNASLSDVTFTVRLLGSANTSTWMCKLINM